MSKKSNTTTPADAWAPTDIEDAGTVRWEIEQEFGRIRRMVAVAGAALEAHEPTDFARESATWMLSDAVTDLGTLHARVHELLGGAPDGDDRAAALKGGAR